MKFKKYRIQEQFSLLLDFRNIEFLFQITVQVHKRLFLFSALNLSWVYDSSQVLLGLRPHSDDTA